MADEGTVGAEIPTKGSPRRGEAAIAALAARQHGVVSRAQLAALGLGAGAIKHRLALGRLHPLYRGVYAVGHRSLRPEAWWLAAVLAAGPDAGLSHRSAAALWGCAARVERWSTSRRRASSRPGRDSRRTASHSPPMTSQSRTGSR